MGRVVWFSIFFFMLSSANAEYYSCLGVYHTSHELADMNDLKLKTTYCQMSELRTRTEVRGIGISEDYRLCKVAQVKIIELLRVKGITCRGAIPL